MISFSAYSRSISNKSRHGERFSVSFHLDQIHRKRQRHILRISSPLLFAGLIFLPDTFLRIIHNRRELLSCVHQTSDRFVLKSRYISQFVVICDIYRNRPLIILILWLSEKLKLCSRR